MAGWLRGWVGWWCFFVFFNRFDWLVDCAVGWLFWVVGRMFKWLSEWVAGWMRAVLVLGWVGLIGRR